MSEEKTADLADEDILKAEPKPDDGGRPPQLILRDRAIGILNNVLKHEPDALHDLIEHRVEVDGKKLEENAVSVVWLEDVPGIAKLGVLGLINGLLGPKEFRISATFNDEGKLIGFSPVDSDIAVGADDPG